MTSGRPLSDRSMSGVMWTYAGTAARLVAQIVLTAILARLLGPLPFGIAGMALVVIGLAGLIADQGLSIALVQRESLTDLQIRIAFTRLLVVGVAFAIAGALAAPLIAEFFREPRLAKPMAALSLVFIPMSLATVSIAVLKRQLRIRALQIVGVVSYVVAYGCVALPMALLHLGIWSLVAAMLCQAGLAALLNYAIAKHPVRPLFGSTQGLSKFGWHMTLNGLMSWLIENVAAVVVGRSFGASALGTYNAAYNLARTTAGNLAGGGLDMVFTSSARADTAGPFRRRAFVASTSLISLLIMPAFVAAALLAETLVLALYGPRWPEAIPLLPPLALAMPALMLSGAASALLTGSGRIGRDSVVYAATLCVLLAGITVAMNVSVQTVAWTVFGAILLRAVIALGTVLKLLAVGARELMIGLRAGLVLAATIPPILLALDVALAGLGLSRVLVLLIDLAAGGALFALGGLATRRLLPQEARWAVAQALRRIPFGVTARWARLFER